MPRPPRASSSPSAGGLAAAVAWLAAAAAAGAGACGDEGLGAATDDPAAHADEAGAGERARWEAAWVENHPAAGGAIRVDGPACSGVVVPDPGPFAGRVALTFDDGPRLETTPDILATLRAHGAPATFFVNGSRVTTDAHRALLAEIAADPAFTLANHTWSHPDMRALEAGARAEQIDRGTEVIEAAGDPVSYFRFPYGGSTCATADEVRARGYHVTGWHVDSADWCFQSGGGTCPAETFAHVPDEYRADMLGFTRSQVEARDGGVILFHDIHPITAASLDAVLDALEADGHAFVRLDDLLAFPLLNGDPATFVGDGCEVDADCVYDGGRCLGAEAGAGRCTLDCELTCPGRAGRTPTRCVMLDEPGAGHNFHAPRCAIDCADDGGCPDGLDCTTQPSPAGVAHDVCW